VAQGSLENAIATATPLTGLFPFFPFDGRLLVGDPTPIPGAIDKATLHPSPRSRFQFTLARRLFYKARRF